ncbi:uncharacterized protein LOC103313561 [Tribolium castaneum]|uniref:Uncharacterized protein n=1 Tax=Tribolium castaneum TaxID=7070 RepID=D6WSF3_TRICA|nr:PREDICTED: uncharacterized protein LOC103313561 [Tribolium castaneum]EFA06634.1 hypothetical protein TcasGA2_TC009554 [Tribolium castaneum]|eukprot:XP_008195325.1 PREDICTED: uncharacterized protein LOC103313561 [Tribolium castaneum]
MTRTLSLLFVLSLITKILAEDAPAKGPSDPGLIQQVNPNYDAVKGLICYQCHSVSKDLQPLCEKSYFRHATPQEKYNMSLQCPSYQGTYCFTKILKLNRHVETFRGCSGPKDIKGNDLKTGCMTTKKEVLCLCDKKFCNRAVGCGGYAVLSTVISFLISFCLI